MAFARVSIASEALDYGGGGERGEQGRCIVFGPPGATSPAARLPTARRRQTSRQTLTHSSSPAPPAVSRQPPHRASLATPHPSQKLSASPPGSPACANPALPPPPLSSPPPIPPRPRTQRLSASRPPSLSPGGGPAEARSHASSPPAGHQRAQLMSSACAAICVCEWGGMIRGRSASRRASRRAMSGLQVADAPSCVRRRSYGATAASACSMRPAETGLKPRAPKRPLSWTSRSSPTVPMSSLSQSSTAAWSLLPSSPAWTSSHDRRSGQTRGAEGRQDHQHGSEHRAARGRVAMS